MGLLLLNKSSLLYAQGRISSKALLHNPVSTANTAHAALAHKIALQSQTARLANFTQWLDQLEGKKLISDNRSRLALAKIKQRIADYPSLTSSEQAHLNLTMITLNRFRSKIGKFKNGDFYKISYPFDVEETLPTPEKFHLQLKRNGLRWDSSSVKKAREIPAKGVVLIPWGPESDLLFGFSFLQTFQPISKTQQEFEQILETLVPPGYTVRITAHELGLSNRRHKFRKGVLHLHLEKTNAKLGQIPLDISLNIGLSMKPYVGIIDPVTRKVLVPFKDKVIARNYLAIFGKYLSPEAKFILEKIAR